MIHLRTARLLLICAIIVITPFAVPRVNAASAADPLLGMLARVPDIAATRNQMYYGNHRAVEVAYPPSKMPATWQEFSALTSKTKDDPALKPLNVWWLAWRYAQSPTSRYFTLAKDMPTILGFEYFAIDQELMYGLPPLDALQLSGRFDAAAVRKAIGARGFTQAERTDTELWCGPAGCEAGNKTDVASVERANLFGGDLGRKQPLLIGDGYLISSPSFDLVNRHIDAIGGKAKSLADAAEYRAAVTAVSQDHVLLQALFLDGKLLRDLADPSLVVQSLGSPRLKKAELKPILEKYLTTYRSLPLYQLVVIADTTTENEQVGLIGLVYGSDADAKAAADVLSARIADYTSLVRRGKLTDLLADQHVSSVQTQIISDTETGKSVLLLKFATPKASPEEILALTADNANPPKVTAPGLVYRLFVTAVNARDINWLSTVPREELEKQLAALK